MNGPTENVGFKLASNLPVTLSTSATTHLDGCVTQLQKLVGLGVTIQTCTKLWQLIYFLCAAILVPVSQRLPSFSRLASSNSKFTASLHLSKSLGLTYKVPTHLSVLGLFHLTQYLLVIQLQLISFFFKWQIASMHASRYTVFIYPSTKGYMIHIHLSYYG